MNIGTSILGQYELGTDREYLITNGLGSFSSASINGNHARQYHGLFISSLIPPLDRFMLLHKAEEVLNNKDLSVSKEIKGNKTYIKDGYTALNNFSYENFPKWTYHHEGVYLEKEQFMVFEREILGLKYKVDTLLEEKNHLKVNFFLNYRDIHRMLKLNEHYNYSFEIKDNLLKITIEELKRSFYIKTNGKIVINKDTSEKEYDFEGNLIKTFTKEALAYDIELGERGDNKLDSSVNSFYVEKDLINKEDLWILVINEEFEIDNYNFYDLYEKEIKRIEDMKNLASKTDTFIRDLAQAGDTFIVKRKSTKEKTILAGYPWFGDWGRDTMIALPGLTLASGRYEDAKSILKTFSKYVDKGMLPNKFPDYDGEELMYNTIDASLWYFYAIHKYLEYTKDFSFVKDELLASMEEILKFHVEGTRYGISLDNNDGLLQGGDKKTQLTWMDVKYKGVAITPRYGKTVEINALWYNALKIYESVCINIDKVYPAEYKEIYTKIEKNYLKTFWNQEGKYLYDYIADGIKNNDVRPNQVFALSLPYSLVPNKEAKEILSIVMKELYTPRGMRSLSKNNEKYVGIYYGSLCSRDSCYHQGTVWSWPLGHFLEAHYKVYKDKAFTAKLMEGIKEHFYNDGAIKNISEIFDGNEPNNPRGCYAQAWSVGEVLRISKEILSTQP